MKHDALLLAALLFGAAAHADEASGRLGLLPTRGGDLPAEVAGRLAAGLGQAFERTGRFTLVDPALLGPKLEEARSLGLDCGPKEVECLLKLGILVELDSLVTISATAAGGRLDVEVLWVDVRGGREAARQRRQVEAAGAGLDAGLGDLVLSLLGAGRPTTTLTVHVAQDGAAVHLDGVAAGESPLPAALARVTEGRHTVVVDKAGFQSVARELDLIAGVPVVLEVVLAPAAVAPPPRGPSPLLLWGGVASAAAGVIAAGACGAGAVAAQAVLADAHQVTGARHDAKVAGQAMVFGALGSLLVAGVGAGLAGLALADAD